MTSPLRRADDMLRGRAVAPSWGIAIVCGLAYGGVMGSFGGLGGDRIWMAVFAAIKVPLLLSATLALSLPSFFVLNTLVGVRSDFPTAFRAIVASQAGLAILLVAMAPLTAFWYASSADYRAAILFNAAMFAVASLGAQGMLRRSYTPLMDREPRHRAMLRA